MTGRLNGKVAVVTGGCSGLGAATARRFVAEGARVVVVDLQNDRGAQMEAELGPNLHFVHGDVRIEEHIAAAVQCARTKFGGLDVLFNNAGVAGTTSLIEAMAASAWDDVMVMLLRSVMLGIKHAVPEMRLRGGGAIINTASVAGLRAQTGPAAYSVAKAAVIHLSKVAAGELAADRIRVNAICPGAVPTQIIGNSLGADRQVAERMLARLPRLFEGLQPLPYAGKPEDIAEACLFLASDAGRFVTGAEIVVDGGLSNMPPASFDPTPRDTSFGQALKDIRSAAEERPCEQ